MLPSFSKKARIYLKYIQNLARKRIYSNNAHNSLATLHISSYAHIYIYIKTQKSALDMYNYQVRKTRHINYYFQTCSTAKLKDIFLHHFRCHKCFF